MKFELKPYNRNTPDQELLDDLKRVAKGFTSDKITKSDYDKKGKFSSGTIEKRFGNWNKALEKAGLELTLKHNLSDIELFQNIEEVWIQLGRQPLYDEMKSPLSKYSTRPYERKFGTWRKSLESFVEYINSDDDKTIEPIAEYKEQKNEQIIKHKTKRLPSERLKVQVLMRDGNKCRLCGITVTGDNIHFDHILAWSRGGETELKNLQVLCSTHNLAKGNIEYPDKQADGQQ
jgi:Homing endonuclease associated repeat/HNH endonuclease